MIKRPLITSLILSLFSSPRHRAAVITIMTMAGTCWPNHTLATNPVWETRILSSGSYWTTIANFGSIGSLPAIGGNGQVVFQTRYPYDDMRSLNVSWVPSFEFPAGSRNNYLFVAGLIVGGIIGFDTLVTTTYGSITPFGQEFLSFAASSSLLKNPC